MDDLVRNLKVRKVSELVYISDRNPSKTGLVADGLSAALQSSPEGFTPNSLHCFFLKLPNDTPTTWRVSETSSGNTFCHRNVKGYQDGELCISMNVSATCRNSHMDLERQYELYIADLHNRKINAELGDLRQKDSLGDKIEGKLELPESEDDEKVVVKPFFFQTSFPTLGKAKKLFSLPEKSWTVKSLSMGASSIDYVGLGTTSKDIQGVPLTVKGNFIVRSGVTTAAQESDKKLQFVPLASMLDPSYLIHFANSVCNEKPLSDIPNSAFSHAVYFHDVDFNCMQWFGLSVSVSRLVNCVFLLEADIFNNGGEHVATVILEGLQGRPAETASKL